MESYIKIIYSIHLGKYYSTRSTSMKFTSIQENKEGYQDNKITIAHMALAKKHSCKDEIQVHTIP